MAQSHGPIAYALAHSICAEGLQLRDGSLDGCVTSVLLDEIRLECWRALAPLNVRVADDAFEVPADGDTCGEHYLPWNF